MGKVLSSSWQGANGLVLMVMAAFRQQLVVSEWGDQNREARSPEFPVFDYSL